MADQIPDYPADPNTVERVGTVISDTAGNEERQVRASDSRGRPAAPELPGQRAGPTMWLWLLLSTVTMGTVVLLAVLLYWQFG